ncbi:MAG: 1-acyl-sn-glycerol-3-phosphate acyltransferase, partial [Candidatus Binatia bacterium]
GLPGFALDRSQLEVHASGRISEIFGAAFARQDGYARQVRMPEGALLLADRMTGIDAEAGSMGKGTLWTETDVTWDSWYLHDGRMPAGIMIESGQADLMLISYLGADFLNRGERVYRLLGCQLTYHGDLPRPGDTLCYEIHVDGHASHDGVRLFFFHYDCRVNGELRLEVRGGQAGFFTDDELAASAGVLWDPCDEDPAFPAQRPSLAKAAVVRGEPRVDAAAVTCTRSAFGADELRAFAAGRPWECFGPGFELTHTHTRTPSIAGGRMLALGEVTLFDPAGGPWKRGYLRAETEVRADDWFFDGHFKNDPCMPGTLMFEGCLQAMSVYLAALGFTLIRDGWRFQPVAGETIDLGCRGQVTPSSRHLVYEVFVDEVIAGPVPTLYADLLCTVDGKKAFHARRAGLQLVPDWPLSSRPGLLLDTPETPSGARLPARVATPSGDVVFDYPTLLACAWGMPSDAFGEMYARFNGTNRIPRLPGPPYHFLTRVVGLKGEIGVLEAGAVAEFEYDVPKDAWYFDENSCASMPFCVLLEAALQPCGWLASYVGSALTQEGELFFRNLDGSGTQLVEILPGAGILATHVTLTSISKFAGMIILGFDVVCTVGAQTVYTMKTVFGFFPGEALANQVGLPTEDAQRKELTDACDFREDLTTRPVRYCGGALALPEPMLLMLDRVTGYWPEGGSHALGRLRGEKDVEASEWFFKAHFFQDPVQPGSLGIEALIQLVQFYMIERGMEAGITNPRFEPLALERTITWKYRGQVIPTNRTIQSTADIVEVGRDEAGPFAIANASLWVDGKRIYEATNVGVRIVAGEEPNDPAARSASRARRNSSVPGGSSGASTDSRLRSASGASASMDTGARSASVSRTHVLDPTVDTWLGDHRPTWNRPALPMMSMIDIMAAAVVDHGGGDAGTNVIAVRDVQVKRWLDFDGPRTIQTQIEQRTPGTYQVTLLTEKRGQTPFSAAGATRTGTTRKRGLTPFCEATVVTGDYVVAPLALEPIAGVAMDSPYDSAALFHGESFHLMTDAVLGTDGASSVLDASRTAVPRGLLHPALLDASLHAIPHDRLHQWSPKISADEVAYPARVSELTLFGPTPTEGRIRCEVRFDGFLAAPSLPRFRIQLVGEHGVWAEMKLVEACFPKGPLGSAEPLARRAFLRDRCYVDGLRLSRVEGGVTRLAGEEVAASNWMPGTIEGVYGSADVETVAVKEHLAAREHLHPRILPDALPLNPMRIEVVRDGDDVVVRDTAASSPLDLKIIHDYWSNLVDGPSDWIGRDLWDGLMQRFVRRVVVTDPQAFGALKGRSAIFVANHQVQIESLLITNILSALAAKPVVTMANAKHEARWIGWILGRLFTYPGCRDPKSIVYFDPNAPESMADILAGIKPGLAGGERSFFVHCDGTRARSCRTPVQRMSSLFLDMSVELDVPVVPVRFLGGLPVEPIEGKAEFPVGMGRQDYIIGTPVSARELRELPYRDRARRVIAAINGLGGLGGLGALGVVNDLEEPLPADRAFDESVRAWSKQTGAGPVEATFYRVLETFAHPGTETRAVIDGAAAGELVVDDTEVGRWLVSFARGLFGPRGPGVRIAR